MGRFFRLAMMGGGMIHKIVIELPFEMEVRDIVFREIDKIITTWICKEYENKNPNRVMWVSGHGAKLSYSKIDAMFLGKREWDDSIPDGEEPVIDDSIYEITISERERYTK